MNLLFFRFFLVLAIAFAASAAMKANSAPLPVGPDLRTATQPSERAEDLVHGAALRQHVNHRAAATE